MRHDDSYRGGENFDLRQMLLCGRRMQLNERIDLFTQFLSDLSEGGHFLHMRCIGSAADRSVKVDDPQTGREREMLMFGSNNYLGLANHPYVRERVIQALRRYGTGIGGPPLLNGYTKLHRELEERLAALKGAEDALVFSSGYGANVGLITGLVQAHDVVVSDAFSHASFCDGLKMSGARAISFPHNDVGRLAAILSTLEEDRTKHDVYVGVEGVYSMDGDLAPLVEIQNLCTRYGAVLIVDDAHGTGVMGAKGKGTAEHFHIHGSIDVTMGTFSKTFAVTGGFVAASKPLVNYLRFFARPYMFSASLPPQIVAAVLAGLDVMEAEPDRLEALRANIAYTGHGLRQIGFDLEPQSGIIPLVVPVGSNLRDMARRFHEAGIFINSIEYPAVPISQQRFRISLMATHTKEDIDRLLEVVANVWRAETVQKSKKGNHSLVAAA